jgi:hypothetical protein
MHLSFLRPLYGRPGPWVSVYLDASHDTEDAAKTLELRWRAARERLTAPRGGDPGAEGGADVTADAATLDAVEQAVLTHPVRPGGYGLAVFGAAGAARYVETTPVPPVDVIAHVGHLPHTMPLVRLRQERVAWLRVVVDRTGADLLGATEGGVTRTSSVTGGEDYPIRKVKPGGWSQPRYQRSAENTWEHNAKDIADAVADLAVAVDPEVVVIAGDVRARQLLVEHLPERWRQRVVQTEAGSRAPGADPEPLDAATASNVAALAAHRVAETIDRFRSEWGRDAAAGTGLAAAVAALQRGQVDTLLVNELSADERLWIGPEPTQLAFTADEVRAMGVDEPRRVRADSAVLRALTATEADLVLVAPEEADLDGGVGALLRYVDAATRHR